MTQLGVIFSFGNPVVRKDLAVKVSNKKSNASIKVLPVDYRNLSIWIKDNSVSHFRLNKRSKGFSYIDDGTLEDLTRCEKATIIYTMVSALATVLCAGDPISCLVALEAKDSAKKEQQLACFPSRSTLGSAIAT